MPTGPIKIKVYNFGVPVVGATVLASDLGEKVTDEDGSVAFPSLEEIKNVSIIIVENTTTIAAVRSGETVTIDISNPRI